MPQGKGTYGTKVGRPPEKSKKPKVNHSGRVKPSKLTIREKLRERKKKRVKPYGKRGY